MAAPALNLDLTGIAIGQPRVPDPIYNAFSAIQTTLNSLGNVHMAADMALATSKLAGGKTARTLRIDPAAFNQGSNTTSVLTVTYHPAVRYQDAVNAYALAGGIRMPADWDGTNFTLRIRGSVDGASVGVVAMAVNILRQQSGLTLVSTFTQSATLNPTAATTNVPFDATTTITGANLTGTDAFDIMVNCDRTLGADTNTNNYHMLGVFIEYTSTI